MKVSIPIGYIDGYISVGHYEVEITPEQYEDLKNGKVSIDFEDEVLVDEAIVIDEYAFTDVNELDFNQMKIIEE